MGDETGSLRVDGGPGLSGGADMRNYMTLLKAIEETGVRAWLVGDTVRMIEMGIQPEVINVVLNSDELERVAAALGTGTMDMRGPYPALRGEIQGVPFRGFCIQGDSIEDDLARRDFSIEAIAMRSDGGLVDPFGGLLDIRNRVIRLSGDDISLIQKDPLRIVRMLRFAAELEMDIFWKTDMDVRAFLDEHPESLDAVADERWGREIIRGMKRRPWRFIRLCDAYGIIPFFLKELNDLKKVPDQRGGSLFDHALRTLQVIESRLDTNKIMQGDSFVLAGLFSLVGANSLEERDFKRKDHIISDYLTRWNVASETIGEVEAIVEKYRNFYEPISEERLCTALLEYNGDAVEATLEFAACVALAEDLPYEDILESNRWNLAQVLRRFAAVWFQTEGTSTRYLTGREVMSLLNIKPGRRVGELLDGLDMAVGTGKVSSRPAAEAWLLQNA